MALITSWRFFVVHNKKEQHLSAFVIQNLKNSRDISVIFVVNNVIKVTILTILTTFVNDINDQISFEAIPLGIRKRAKILKVFLRETLL